MDTLPLIPWFKLHGWHIVGTLELQPFGILVAIGILIGARVAKWRAQETGIDSKLLWTSSSTLSAVTLCRPIC